MYDHIKSNHSDQPEADLKQILSSFGIKLNKEKKHWLRNREVVKILNEQKGQMLKIRKKYKQINKTIERINSWDYLEDKSRCDILLTALKNKSSKIDFGDIEVIVVNETKDRIEKLKMKPTKGEYIKRYCKPIYFTWDNITFKKNSIIVTPLKGKKRSINMEGSLSVLNHIKIDYFKRLCKDEVYRIVYERGKIKKEFSPDLNKIKNLIIHRYNSKNIKSNSKENVLPNSLKGYSKSQIINMISTGGLKNKYLKYPASIVLDSDEILALQEWNNNIVEESLIFVFYRRSKVFVLWENINSQRAGYLFYLNDDNYREEIPKLKSLVIGNIKNKRQSLFNKIALDKFDINCKFYKCLIHENELNYKHKIQSYING